MRGLIVKPRSQWQVVFERRLEHPTRDVRAEHPFSERLMASADRGRHVGGFPDGTPFLTSDD
jgi:hypothetical protein